MKPFNLDEYIKNPSRKIVTRDGKNVTRVLCTNARGLYPMVVLVESYDGKNDNPVAYTKEGRYIIDCAESKNDLFFAPEKKVGWINIYYGKDGPIVGNVVFTSKEEAEESKRHCCDFTQGLYLTTAKIEWEE